MSALVVIPADELRAMLETAVRDGVRAALSQLRPQPGEDHDRLVGVIKAANRLGLSTSTTYKLAERLELPSVKVGSRVLFKVADLVAYAEERRRSPERVRQLALTELPRRR